MRTEQACDELAQHYDNILHTTPPFFMHTNNPELEIHQCYMSALSQVVVTGKPQRIASPLLGAGARGFPTDVAVKVAALATFEWMESGSTNSANQTLAFGLLEEGDAVMLAEAFEKCTDP